VLQVASEIPLERFGSLVELKILGVTGRTAVCAVSIFGVMNPTKPSSRPRTTSIGQANVTWPSELRQSGGGFAINVRIRRSRDGSCRRATSVYRWKTRSGESATSNRILSWPRPTCFPTNTSSPSPSRRTLPRLTASDPPADGPGFPTADVTLLATWRSSETGFGFLAAPRGAPACLSSGAVPSAMKTGLAGYRAWAAAISLARPSGSTPLRNASDTCHQKRRGGQRCVGERESGSRQQMTRGLHIREGISERDDLGLAEPVAHRYPHSDLRLHGGTARAAPPRTIIAWILRRRHPGCADSTADTSGELLRRADHPLAPPGMHRPAPPPRRTPRRHRA